MNYRINPNILLQINNSPNYSHFLNYDKTIDGKNYSQALELVSSYNVLDNSVWNFGDYQGRINKVFNSEKLVDLSELIQKHSHKKDCSIMLRQGFNWHGIIGILVVIKGMNTGYVYISRLLTINNFLVNFETSRELIDNAFWTSETLFEIPDLVNGENLMVSIEPISFTDVIAEGSTIGLITTYPASNFNFEPLISEMVLPTYIDVSVNISETLFLRVQPVTLEQNKTLEQSLLDYFGLTNKIVPINISHVIKYGNDDDGFKTLRISNEDDAYGTVIVGLGFNQTTGTKCTVFVSTEFLVNNILMKREHSLVFDYASILNPLLEAVILKDTDVTVFPVQVKNETIVTHNVIKQETEQKIITISQPVYVEIVNENILFENKNISFNDIKVESYMEITDGKTGKSQYIQSLKTVDNKFYFPLNTIAKPAEKSTFRLISVKENLLIGKGTFID